MNTNVQAHLEANTANKDASQTRNTQHARNNADRAPNRIEPYRVALDAFAVHQPRVDMLVLAEQLLLRLLAVERRAWRRAHVLRRLVALVDEVAQLRYQR